MPVARNRSLLKNSGQINAYTDLLRDAFNPAAIAGVMCRNTLRIGWRG